MSTQPTDEEIDAVTLEVLGYAALDKNTNETARLIARAVLAKWGTPPAVAGEPVAWKHDCAALLTNDVELWIKACPHCGKPRTTTPQPTQAQAGAVPLTVEQKHARNPYRHSRGAASIWLSGFAAAELWYRIGIKGGQHGTE